MNSEQSPALAAADDEQKRITAAAGKFRLIKCSVFASAAVLILATVAVILGSTVFRLRCPIFRIGNVTVGISRLISNVTLIADVWVKNPNFASIEYGNVTTTLFYRGVAVGESRDGGDHGGSDHVAAGSGCGYRAAPMERGGVEGWRGDPGKFMHHGSEIGAHRMLSSSGVVDRRPEALFSAAKEKGNFVLNNS
ncbi:hypothetical protein SASPL_105926 [Salvia splendens]|uniref:Late embryogenesis abundant protein LEA-2 subgroup domain-containing protein n=1 Tax=Salvia splendens TaxID=180675 RepID=A0A8X8YKV5_SALSN|nr:hypothetical protein SASPL_105926 [Salvia splendens]